MPIKLNDLECRRFGIVAARLTDPTAPLDAVDAVARAASVDLLTTRIDVADLPRVHALEQAGHRLMDTLVYYARPLTNLPDGPRDSGQPKLRQATPSDSGDVAALARAAFSDYIGHYHADPQLDSVKADAAYVEWAETSVQTCSDAAPVLVAQDGRDILGFLTLRRNSAKEYEIVLNAVHPDAAGKGVYGSLVAGSLDLAQQAGAQRVIVSTQINNYAVQRIWSRLGLCHYKSIYTFHKWYEP
ncbi:MULTISPECIES: GNAT family N-acetyltransferase [Rhodobacterales]|uniref:GNAT family N-acetyltransferase n=1 Tax=Rhodobacterales TaxID=204455 RepID=UPI0032972EE4